jgi:hypothetical protein
VRQLITQAVSKLGLQRSFELVQPHRYKSILERIIASRTFLSKAAVTAPWLWESLRPPVAAASFVEPLSALRSLLPVGENVWFVAEDADSPQKREGNFWLYETTSEAICAILVELPQFEYYAVSKKCEWLVCENHHGLLIASGEPMASLVSQLPNPSVKGTSRKRAAPYVER